MSGIVASWPQKLIEFDIKCITQNAVKGEAIAKLLTNHSVLPFENKEIHFNTDMELVKWTLCFDGAAMRMPGGARSTAGAGVVLVEPSGNMYLHAYNLSYFCTKNSAKYKPILLGLLLAMNLKVEYLLVRGDSLLVIQEAVGNFEIKEAHLVVCDAGLMQLLKNFKVVFEQIP